MKIAILVKQVPSSEARIRIAEGTASIDPADVEYVVNPYDEYALEAGLQLKEKFGGETIAVTLGDADSEKILRECLALGIDRAVRVWDSALEKSDTLGRARVLSAACASLQADLVLCGKLAIDEENSAVGPQVAEFLEWPHVSVLSEITPESGTSFRLKREIEGGNEIWEAELPVVLTANKGLNEPRRKTMKGIMAAKKKPVEVLDLGGLGLDAARLEPRARLAAMEYPAPRKAGQVLQGEPSETVPQLVSKLRDEAKVI